MKSLNLYSLNNLNLKNLLLYGVVLDSKKLYTYSNNENIKNYYNKLHINDKTLYNYADSITSKLLSVNKVKKLINNYTDNDKSDSKLRKQNSISNLIDIFESNKDTNVNKKKDDSTNIKTQVNKSTTLDEENTSTQYHNKFNDKAIYSEFAADSNYGNKEITNNNFLNRNMKNAYNSDETKIDSSSIISNKTEMTGKENNTLINSMPIYATVVKKNKKSKKAKVTADNSDNFDNDKVSYGKIMKKDTKPKVIDAYIKENVKIPEAVNHAVKRKNQKAEPIYQNVIKNNEQLENGINSTYNYYVRPKNTYSAVNVNPYKVVDVHSNVQNMDKEPEPIYATLDVNNKEPEPIYATVDVNNKKPEPIYATVGVNDKKPNHIYATIKQNVEKPKQVYGARLHKDEKVKHLYDSIVNNDERFGYVTPLVNKKNLGSKLKDSVHVHKKNSKSASKHKKKQTVSEEDNHYINNNNEHNASSLYEEVKIVTKENDVPDKKEHHEVIVMRRKKDNSGKDDIQNMNGSDEKNMIVNNCTNLYKNAILDRVKQIFDTKIGQLDVYNFLTSLTTTNLTSIALTDAYFLQNRSFTQCPSTNLSYNHEYVSSSMPLDNFLMHRSYYIPNHYLHILPFIASIQYNSMARDSWTKLFEKATKKKVIQANKIKEKLKNNPKYYLALARLDATMKYTPNNSDVINNINFYYLNYMIDAVPIDKIYESLKINNINNIIILENQLPFEMSATNSKHNTNPIFRFNYDYENCIDNKSEVNNSTVFNSTLQTHEQVQNKPNYLLSRTIKIPVKVYKETRNACHYGVNNLFAAIAVATKTMLTNEENMRSKNHSFKNTEKSNNINSFLNDLAFEDHGYNVTAKKENYNVLVLRDKSDKDLHTHRYYLDQLANIYSFVNSTCNSSNNAVEENYCILDISKLADVIKCGESESSVISNIKFYSDDSRRQKRKNDGHRNKKTDTNNQVFAKIKNEIITGMADLTVDLRLFNNYFLGLFEKLSRILPLDATLIDFIFGYFSSPKSKFKDYMNDLSADTLYKNYNTEAINMLLAKQSTNKALVILSLMKASTFFQRISYIRDQYINYIDKNAKKPVSNAPFYCFALCQLGKNQRILDIAKDLRSKVNSDVTPVTAILNTEKPSKNKKYNRAIKSYSSYWNESTELITNVDDNYNTVYENAKIDIVPQVLNLFHPELFFNRLLNYSRETQSGPSPKRFNIIDHTLYRHVTGCALCSKFACKYFFEDYTKIPRTDKYIQKYIKRMKSENLRYKLGNNKLLNYNIANIRNLIKNENRRNNKDCIILLPLMYTFDRFDEEKIRTIQSLRLFGE